MSKNKLDLIIDLHRDSVDKKLVTYKIDGKSYAKILFVVGGENKNYKDNYSLSHHLNNMIASKYPDISRGIIIKSGKNVNGVYNQNLSKDMILLELGSNNSSFEEVKNTITLLAPIIGEYLHEKG
jgi:stage II sporulation protein P